MARASVRTLLPLDTLFKVMGVHPLHGNQVTVADLAPSTTCDVPLLQYNWQHADRIGREGLAQVVAEAETDIVNELKFSPMPDWRVEEDIYAQRQPHGWFAVQPVLRAGLGQFISGGRKAKTLIDADAAIVYTDADGDGYKETATITASTTVTDTQEFGIFYPGKSGSDEWEVRPLKSVSVSGGVVTIVVRREQLVTEALQEALQVRAVDGLIDGNFLTTVDVYRVYNDPSVQVQFMWENSESCCTCGSDDCTDCTFSTQYGCLMGRNVESGMLTVHAGVWNATDEVFDIGTFAGCRRPDRYRLWYRSGFQDKQLDRPLVTMAPKYQRAVAFLAMSRLHRPLCACKTLDAQIAYYREDLAYQAASQAGSKSYQLRDNVLECPFGTTRGAIEAWRLIRKERIGEAVLNT